MTTLASSMIRRPGSTVIANRAPSIFNVCVSFKSRYSTEMRIAVVGVGANVFSLHAQAIKATALDVLGVADINLAAAERRAEELGCPAFADHRALLEATKPEAVAVLAPHPFHASIALD